MKMQNYSSQIPSRVHLELCQILDPVWKQLAGRLGFMADDLNDFERAIYTAYGSPTDKMLNAWDAKNHTITELFDKLYQIKHARGMMLLEKFVDEAHRQKIKEIQGEQPEDNYNESSPTNGSGIHQRNPHNFKGQQGSSVESAAAVHREMRHDTNMQPGRVPQHGNTNHQSIPSGVDPNQLHNPSAGHWNPAVNPESVDEHLPSQSSWNGAPSPVMRGSSVSSSDTPPQLVLSDRKDGFQFNLDGGTEKQLNSPLIRPASCISDENNVGSTTNKKHSAREKERLANLAVLGAVMTLKYEDIRRATDDFSDSYKVGAGSFGTVYYMMDNYTKYAIKRLIQDEDPHKNASSFSSQMKEITHLATYRHPNIVTLCFNCTDGPEPCLIYEYMQRGSLEDNLQLRWCNKEPLSWELRNEILLGAAIGLNFLHNAQDRPLIHGDIKSANILLDEYLKPKIGDFGLARYGPEKGRTHTLLHTARAYGTLPYLPKDFLKSFKLSVKVDVYSFGVVMMETLTGQKAGDEKREPKNKWLREIVTDVRDSLNNEVESEKKIISQLLDPNCSDWPWELAWEVLDLSLKCTAYFHSERPVMEEVVKTLQGINNRIQETSLRKRSLPTQNTEPLPSGCREPEESYAPNFTELPNAPSPRQTQKDESVLSALDKKLQEVTLGAPGIDSRATGYQGQELMYGTRDDPYLRDGYPGVQQRQPNRPPHMPQDLRSVSQDPSLHYDFGAAVGPHLPQSYPSSTVASSYMNRPTPPSTVTPPSTNLPASYGYPQNGRIGGYFPQGQAHYMDPRQYDGQLYHRDEPRYEDPTRDPYRQQSPYDDHYSQSRYDPPNYLAPASQYPAPQRQQPNPWGAPPPPYYDINTNSGLIPSINPTQFRPGFPAPSASVNQISNMQGQMSKLDPHQLPVYIQRGPDSSRETSVATGNAPSPTALNSQYPQEGSATRNNPTTHRQTSYVQFPDGMISSSQSSQEALDHDHTPSLGQQLPNEMSRTTGSPTPNKPQCASSVEPNPDGFTNPPTRNSPVPSEHTNPNLTSQQSNSTKALSSSFQQPEHLQQSTPPVSSHWNGERRTPVPSQHTDKLPTQSIQQEEHSATSTQQQDSATVAVDQAPQFHSAPPELGMSMEEQLVSLSTMPRVPTQMTEPLCEPPQGRK